MRALFIILLAALCWWLIFVMVGCSPAPNYPHGVEPPPALYTHCTHRAKVTTVSNPDRSCREVLGPNPRSYIACYVPASNTIIMPPADKSPFWRALLAHEYAHECGWRHTATGDKGR